MEKNNWKGKNIVIGIIVCLVIALVFVSYIMFIVKNENITNNNKTDSAINDNSTEKENNMDYSGKFEKNGSDITFTKNGSGYDVDITIFRTAVLTGKTTNIKDGKLTITATTNPEADNIEFVFDYNTKILTVTNSNWEILPNGITYEFDSNDVVYSNLTNISCYYDKVSEKYNQECEIYNPKSLYDKYLPNDHIINKLIVADNKIIYLILSNGDDDYYAPNTKYHEYLYSVEKKNSYLINDNYRRIAGMYIKNNAAYVVLYNETYATKFEFKTINLNDNSIVKEFVYPLSNVESGFTNPVIVSKNNKNYIILTLASEYTDRLVLTTDFKKIDKGLAYEGYELTEEGNIKIFVESHKYKIYDDAGNLISEGQY